MRMHSFTRREEKKGKESKGRTKKRGGEIFDVGVIWIEERVIGKMF